MTLFKISDELAVDPKELSIMQLIPCETEYGITKYILKLTMFFMEPHVVSCDFETKERAQKAMSELFSIANCFDCNAKKWEEIENV